jgi:hypothetical protein
MYSRLLAPVLTDPSTCLKERIGNGATLLWAALSTGAVRPQCLLSTPSRSCLKTPFPYLAEIVVVVTPNILRARLNSLPTATTSDIGSHDPSRSDLLLRGEIPGNNERLTHTPQISAPVTPTEICIRGAGGNARAESSRRVESDRHESLRVNRQRVSAVSTQRTSRRERKSSGQLIRAGNLTS